MNWDVMNGTAGAEVGIVVAILGTMLVLAIGNWLEGYNRDR